MWKKLSTVVRCRRDDGGVIEDLDTLGTELLQRDTFDPDEGFVGHFDLVFLGQIVERGLFDDSRFGLRTSTLFTFNVTDV